MQTRKRILGILLTLALVAGLLAIAPITAHAGTDPVTIDISTLGGADIPEDGSATDSQWAYDDLLKELKLTTEGGDYVLVGANADLGVWVVAKDVNVELNGVSVTASTGYRAFSDTGDAAPGGLTVTFAGVNTLVSRFGAGSPNHGFAIDLAFAPAALKVEDSAKLTITNSNTVSETHTFTKASAGSPFKWKLTGATTSDPLTNDSITVTVAAGATGSVELVTPITIAAIPGLTAPKAGGVPVTAITETEQYTGTVAWNGNPSVFVVGAVYTAVVTLTPKPGYTEIGVEANYFTAAGSRTASNAVNSGVITVVFPPAEAQSGPSVRYVGLFGFLNTKYVSSPWNWFKFIILFGWIWMWFL